MYIYIYIYIHMYMYEYIYIYIYIERERCIHRYSHSMCTVGRELKHIDIVGV